MESVTLGHDQLVELLSRSLGHPAAQVGARLRSERELADELGIGRRRVAYALNRLAQRGYLVRRGAKGTFVRHLPETINASGQVIAPEKLFQLLQAEPWSAEQEQPRRRRMLGLWWGHLASMSQTNRLILDGMAEHAQHLGHVLTFHSAPGRIGADADWSALMTEHPRDGLIISYRDVPETVRLFEAARHAGRQPPPLVHFFTASVDVNIQPLVYMDTHEAISRGVRLLAKAGYQRIGLIAIPRWGEMAEQYDLAMRRADLSYRAVAQGDQDWPNNGPIAELPAIHDGRRYAAQLLSADPAPDALYVADDVMMLGVAEVLAEKGLTPGKDLGVIAHSVGGKPQAPGPRWSRLEFDARRFGRMVVDLLLDRIEHPDLSAMNQTMLATWLPGDSHERRT